MRVQAKCAFTLVELIIGISLTIVVTALIASLVVRHQRAYGALNALLDSRAGIRDGADILSADFRGVSPTADGVLAANDTAVEFYSALGASTLCATPSANRIVIPPDSLPGGRVLSAWLSVPDTGDYALIYSDSSRTASPGWQRLSIAGFSPVATSPSCPASAGLLTLAEVAAGGSSYEVSFAPPVSVTAVRGAPVRFTRRVRYSIYRASDGKWYLGYRRCGATGCASVQPVSGPYASDFGTPLALRYFGAGGTILSGTGPTTSVERVEIVFRVSTRPWSAFPGMSVFARDSVLTTVTMRNRW